MKAMNESYEKKALRALYELGRATMGASNIDDIFKNILDKSMEIMGVTKASIMRYDPADSTLRIIAARGIPKKVIDSVKVRAGAGISGKVFSSGRPLLVTDVKKRSDALREKRYKSSSLISAPVSCLPLKVRGRAVGVINMTDKKYGRPFTPSDLELLTTIAAQAAAYVHMYDMINDLRETELLKHEIGIAKEIQMALLPHKMPQLVGISASGRCLVAERLGGDYFDFLTSGWAPPAFVIADVSGHDIGAALLMSAFRSSLRAEVGIPVLPPSAVVRRMNRVLFDDLVKAEQFISMFYLQYIHSSRTVRFASAGHHPALLYRPSGKTFRTLSTDGQLLGIERGEHYYEEKCPVQEGDVIVMYTDGLIEAKRPDGAQFGAARLRKIIAAASGKRPEEMIDRICNEVKKFAGGARIRDDITLMVMKIGR